MPNTIMLATDLSQRCDRALDRAAMLAREWQARLLIVHVLEEKYYRADAPSWRQAIDPLEVAQRRVRHDVGESADLRLEILIERGEPGVVIPQLAARHGVELVVCGIARDEALGRLLLGSTVDTLTKRLSSPLLVVKRRPHEAYRHLVFASDLSPGSQAAGALAGTWWPAASIDLFHAFSLPFEGLLENKARQLEQAKDRALDDCRRFTAGDVNGRYATIYCEHGEPPSLLSELVEVRNVDLVVVGTAGRSGLAGMLLGSVAQRVLDRVPVDVLVAPYPRS